MQAASGHPIIPGNQFASDNCAGICPAAWQAMQEANATYSAPYGNDRWTQRAGELLRELFEVDCDIFFTFNGTAANSLALASLCRSYHAIIAHVESHLQTDECGGPEFFSHGSKLLPVPGAAGKVDPSAVAQTAASRTDVHFPKAKALSVTQSTELGAVYSTAELGEIHDVKQHLGLHLHMDGARFANALATLDCAPKEITWQVGVDVLCLGGTKNGMAVGDCVIFFNRDLAEDFTYRCKQAGQLASKMCFLSAPWVGILQDETWLANARHANAMARELASQLDAIPGITLARPVEANAVFAHFPQTLVERLRSQGWEFYEFTAEREVRLMCSWATTPHEIDAFTTAVQTVTEQAGVGSS